MARNSTAHSGPGCPFCGKPLPEESLTTRNIRCDACAGAFEAVRFDPPVRRVTIADLGAAGPEGATPCGNHPGNAATANCGRCGTFICSLCEIDASGTSVCPPCFERLTTDGVIGVGTGKFRDYGAMSRAAAGTGCIIYFLGILIGPLAVYYGIRGLRQKKQLNETDGLAAIWVAILVGATEFFGWIALVIAVVADLVK